MASTPSRPVTAEQTDTEGPKVIYEDGQLAIDLSMLFLNVL
jgi:hypothetical protein